MTCSFRCTRLCRESIHDCTEMCNYLRHGPQVRAEAARRGPAGTRRPGVPGVERVKGGLGEHLPDTPRARATLALALDFYTWRNLVRRSGLSSEEAVETMVAALRCQ